MKRFALFTIVAILLVQVTAQGQSIGGINIFGYYQGQFEQSNVQGDFARQWNTFGLQQMNLLLEKDLGSSLSGFVGLQFSGNYASDKSWGSFNVEEAWMKYSPVEYFNVKAGLLVPTFNNLNEIKTKTPLLPYVIRPLVYESPMAALLAPSSFVPEKAFFQIYGAFPVGSAKIDYSLFTGNNGPDFVSSTLGIAGSLSGQDTSKFKLFGGRVGIRTGSLKVGVSGTYDRNNPGNPVNLPSFFYGATPIYDAASMLGSVVRVRVGADVSFQIAGVSFEGEVISVNHSPTEAQQAILDVLPLYTRNNLYSDLNKLFYYAAVSYDFNDQWYGFATYSKYQDKFNMVFHAGMDCYGFGGGFRPTGSVVVKAQYARFAMLDLKVANYSMDRYTAAVSIYF